MDQEPRHNESGPTFAQAWARGIIYNDFSETIGRTPLVRLARLKQSLGFKADILLKLEFFNPLSSVKDRIATAMIRVLEQSGTIAPGRSVLIEPTSGNTGIALAFVAAARGYRLIVVMPETMSLERRSILKYLGAEIELTSAAGGMSEAVARAEELKQSIPNSVIPGQFDNPANPAVHALTTAEEIWQDTAGKLDALVIAIGTGGTLTGCASTLKPRKSDLNIVAVEPAGSPLLTEGKKGPHKIQGIGTGFVPSVLDLHLIDEVVTVEDDEAMAVARLLAKTEGIPGGISTGANLAAALQIAARENMAGKMIVTLAPSSAERYISSDLFKETAVT